MFYHIIEKNFATKYNCNIMTTTNEKPPKKSNAPKFEVMLILVLFLCFIMWSISRCNDKRKSYQEEEMIRNGEDLNTAVTNIDTVAIQNTTTTNSTTTTPPPPPVATPTPKPAPKPLGSTLYITIDGLNMRNYPHLDSVVVAKLPLFEMVTFMNEVTDFKQEINLGKEIANEPWVKIQTKRGKEGWVYGAGVHYHKKKREGVQ